MSIYDVHTGFDIDRDYMMEQAFEIVGLDAICEDPLPEYWTTRAGERIAWADLTDAHLANICAMAERTERDAVVVRVREEQERRVACRGGSDV